MVFENIKELEGLSIKSREKLFGSYKRESKKIDKHRSNMMLNPLNLKHLNSLDNNEADVITLNLEDGISPFKKQEALSNIALFLSNLKETKSSLVVRVNPIDNGGLDEIRFLNSFCFDAIRVPKIKSARDVEIALSNLDAKKELHLSLETKEAFSKIGELKIDSNVTTLNLGILDLLASLNLPQSLLKMKNQTTLYILSKFLIDSKTFGFHPVSFMFQDYNNVDAFREWCEHEKSLGFSSKACMGPKQTLIANEIFGVSQKEIQRALYIKSIFEKNSKEGLNGFMDSDYGFIDEPIYKDALNTLKEI